MKYVKRAIAWLALAATLIWAADWALLRYKVANNGNAFGQVMVRHHYELQLRNKQIEQLSDKPQPQECVLSLFPHCDESPCWYLRRNANTTEKLDGRPWHFWKAAGLQRCSRNEMLLKTALPVRICAERPALHFILRRGRGAGAFRFSIRIRAIAGLRSRGRGSR